jgi:ribosomal protein L37AE/L43A
MRDEPRCPKCRRNELHRISKMLREDRRPSNATRDAIRKMARAALKAASRRD